MEFPFQRPPTVDLNPFLTMSEQTLGGKHEEKFSAWLFIFTVIVSLAGILALVRLIAPSVWDAQFAASTGAFILCFVAVHAVGGTFEYFFHRYILHAPLIPALSYYYKQHTLHHALTHIGYHRSKQTNEEVPGLIDNDPIARNTFPIEQEKQFEASYFPWYTLILFSLFVTPLLVVGQWLLPTAPVMLAGYIAIAFSLSLYELVHAVEHWPQDTWDRLIAHPRYGRMWRKAYAFHLRHHADIRCNEGISGIFGLPLIDFALGTYVDPETLYKHGESVCPTEFKSPVPRFAFIRWLDRKADEAVKNRRAQARRA
jgi:hemolysin III